MLDERGKRNSREAVESYIKICDPNSDRVHEKRDILVQKASKKYHDKIDVAIYDNIEHGQCNVDISWEDGSSKKEYEKIGLHAGYNTNFQKMKYKDGTLSFKDGDYTITIM